MTPLRSGTGRLLPAIFAAAAFAPHLAGGRLVFAGEQTDLEWARENHRKGQYVEAVAQYQKALAAAQPAERAAIALDMARARRTAGQYAQAIKDVEDLLAVSPKDASALTLKGELLTDVGKYADAAKAFDDALAADAVCLRAKAFRKILADTTGDKDLSKKIADFFFAYWEEHFDELNAMNIKDPLLPTYVGLAFEGENPKDAYEVCYTQSQKVLKKAGKFHEAPFLYAGRLALDKYDFGKAANEFGTVLKANPRQPDALLGMALTMAQAGQGDRAKVQEALNKVFEINPNHVEARAALASVYLDEDKTAEASAEIEKALAVNPSSLDALSLRAAILLRSDDAAGYEAACRKVLEINPRHAELFCTVGDSIEHKRGFRKAQEQFQKAIATDPGYWRGYYSAGMNLIRLGEEEKGRELLLKAYRMNGFNVWARNMLKVVDKILGVADQNIEPQFKTYKSDHFVTKFHESEAEVLNLYAVEVQEQAWKRFTKRFGFEPRSGILIEYFPTHGDFSARTVGLPGLGALGCCFGESITLLSPKLTADKVHPPFNWAKVLEHEFIHVITLQLTDYRITRWATEGFSMYMEGDEQIHWDQLLIDSIHRKRILPLAKLETGFQREDFPGRIQLTYYQVQLLLEYLDKTYGWDCLAKLLEGYKQNKKTEVLLPEITGKSLAELDAGFLDWLTKVKAAAILLRPGFDPGDIVGLEKAAADKPQDAQAQADLAVAYFRIGQAEKARAAADKALAIEPNNLDALTVKGMVLYRADKNWNGAKEAFLKAADTPGKPFFAWLYLGLLYKKEAAAGKAIEAFEKARAIYPRYTFDDNPYHHLHDLYVEKGEKDKALKVMQDCFRLKVADFEACKKALKLALELNRLDDAAEAAWAGNMVNTLDKEHHMLAGQAYEKAKNWPYAEREFLSATVIDPEHIPAWLALGRVCVAQGKLPKAVSAAEKVLSIDGTHAEAKALKEAAQKK